MVTDMHLRSDYKNISCFGITIQKCTSVAVKVYRPLTGPDLLALRFVRRVVVLAIECSTPGKRTTYSRYTSKQKKCEICILKSKFLLFACFSLPTLLFQ